MTLFTSTKFASAAASGTDWRDTCKSVLEELGQARTDGDGFNIGFLYVTDGLAEDVESILTLFQSVTGIDLWTGCVGVGVCGCGEELTDGPAISAMIGRIPEGHVHPFSATHSEKDKVKGDVSPWLDRHDPMLVLMHGSAVSDNHPEWMSARIAETVGGFAVGGLTSSGGQHIHYAGDMMTNGFSGLIFSDDIPVSTVVSQGCAVIGPAHTVTEARGHIVTGLDGHRPFEVFIRDLKTMAQEKTGLDPDKVMLDTNQDGEPDIPPDLQDLFEGDVHVALPVRGSDTKDFLVRNLAGLDAENGSIALSCPVENGEQIVFVHRNAAIMRSELSHRLVGLRTRIHKEHGVFEPKGALYISCAARSSVPFSESGADDAGGEMALIREVIGDVPLAGFYAGGEISGGRLYGYTGILILFL